MKKLCAKHAWRTLRSGVEKCENCGTRFPCVGKCEHVDCADQRLKLKEK